MLNVLLAFIAVLSSVFRNHVALRVEILALRHQIGMQRACQALAVPRATCGSSSLDERAWGRSTCFLLQCNRILREVKLVETDYSRSHWRCVSAQMDRSEDRATRTIPLASRSESWRKRISNIGWLSTSIVTSGTRWAGLRER